MKRKIIKLLLIGIIIWAVSASYGHYISYASPGRHIWVNIDEGVFSSLWEKIFPGSLGIKAKAVIVVDANTNEVVYSKNEDRSLPIASLTKLATALVYVESSPDLSKLITIQKSDFPPTNDTKLYAGETITAGQCLHLCLMCSDNAAANALARSAGISRSLFIREMNELAVSLGMKRTSFTEPTGIDSGNKSSAADYIKLMQRAFSSPTIKEISSRKTYQFKASNREITHTLYNTNRLLYSRWNVLGGKTGYISQSGYCLALDAYDQTGRRINAVILGAPSNHYRYRDANRLLAYAGRN